MSRAKKHVVHDLLHSLPEPQENEFIAKLISIQGGNIVLVSKLTDEKLVTEQLACRIPNKYKNVIQLRVGSYFIVCVEEHKIKDEMNKTYEVSHPLFAKQITHLKKAGLWPKGEDTEEGEDNNEGNIDDDDEDSMDDLFRNNNRATPFENFSSSDEEESEEEED